MYLEEQPEVPYDILRYLIAVINYGGRVTDNKDEILIGAILKLFITEDALNSGYSFSESGKYFVPEDLSLESMKEYSKKLPLEDKPEVIDCITLRYLVFMTMQTSHTKSTQLRTS